MIRSIFCLLFLTSALHAQNADGLNPVALHTSDPKFAPRWVDVPAPSIALHLEQHYGGWAEGRRPPGTYEIAYALVDESWAISPVSPAVTVTTTAHNWECVGTTPGVPLWTRATGILWVYRQQGQTAWKPFGVDLNRPHAWTAIKPFKAITGWNHSFGGHVLYQAAIGFPDLADSSFYPASTVLTTGPPAPSVRVLEQANSEYDITYAWACNQGETALSPILSVSKIGGVADDNHKSMILLRTSPAGRQQPPQGALGMYLYMRRSGGQWHRQPSPDGSGNLWQLDYVTIPVTQYVESGIRPASDFGPTVGRSYLSSLHLALTHWNRDIIVDNDVSICCPLISEYNGQSWDYQPKNHWTALYHTSLSGTWVLTIDGKATLPMPIVIASNGGTEWPSYQSAVDAAFGVGNVRITYYWHNYAPKIEFAGKYAATDLTGRYTIQVKDATEAVIEPVFVAGADYTGPQQDNGKGQGWVLADAGLHKFKRKITTSNGGGWRVSDAAATPATPDMPSVTGYPMGWMHWLECSQRTKLQGCDFKLMQSRIGVAACDNSGGGAFHFNITECTVSPHPTNTQPVTYGFRCLGSSSWGIGGHCCSELITEKFHILAKFPIVCEGQQAANWQLRDTNCTGDSTFDSTIITQANAGSITCGGRFTCDGARSMLASVWCKRLDIADLWIDGGMPCLMDCNANSFSTLTLRGGKINQWESWIHAITAPAGSAEAYTMRLITDNLDSQTNGPVQASLCNPKAGQAVYKPRDPAEVPYIFQSIAPVVVQP